jgi:hypothetical protein
VRIKYGLQGYGLYWYCLELIAQNIEAHNLTFELEHDAEIIAHDVNISRDLVEEMMRFMVDQGLFEAGDGGRIFCMKMLKRMDTSMTSNAKMRQLILSAKQNHDGVMMGHDSVMQERKKDRYIGGDKSPQIKKTTKFTPPSLEEVTDYCESMGYTFDPESFIAHHATRGWKLKGGQSMKCWKSACTTFQKNEERWNPKTKDPRSRFV